VPKVQHKPIKRTSQGSKERSKRKPKCSLVWCTGVSGVPPDSVRCTREDRLRTLHLQVSQAQLHYNSPDFPVCQRSNGYLRAMVDSDSEQCSIVHAAAVRVASQRCTGLSGATPDCPVPHEDKASNGRPAPTLTNRLTWRLTGHCPVAHRTVRCTLRRQPSPTATIWLVAINTTPTGHFKKGEPKQHSKSSS
jgi:hypothetical protein